MWSFPAGRFDVITMYHALEHVEDPVGILARLRGWLVDGGTLLVEVPNVEARCILPAHRFHFAHFYNFNRATLEATGRRAGFDPVQTTTSPDGGNLIGIFRASRGEHDGEADSRETTRAWLAPFEATRVPIITCPRPCTPNGPRGRLRKPFEGSRCRAWREDSTARADELTTNQ